ncbi:nucleoside-diphosphate-sugar epimerase family protein [Aspergillus floccosus]
MAAVLITGATGEQGGSLIRSLVARKSPLEILAVTRNARSSSVQKLTKLSSNIKLVEGNLDDPAALFQNARQVTQATIWGVYSVQVAIGNGAPEEKQGKGLVDESLKQKVQFFVYSSVDRGGDASYTTPTKVPHFINKHNIEHHLNLVPGFFGKVFATCFKIALKGKPLQMVATDDIGFFGAEAFMHPQEYQNKSLSLAGDELTYDQFAQIFQQKTGEPIPSTYRFLCSVFMASMKDMGYMFKWFHDSGYKANILELKKINPDLKDFGTWLERDSEFSKK